MCLYIRVTVEPATIRSVYLSMYPSIYLSIDPSLYIYRTEGYGSYIHPSIYPSIRRMQKRDLVGIHPRTRGACDDSHPSIYLCIHLSIYPSIHLYTYTGLRGTGAISIHPSIHRSVCNTGWRGRGAVSIHPSIYPSIRL